MKTSKRIYKFCILLIAFLTINTQFFSQKTNDLIISLEDIDGNPHKFTKSELIELLCNSDWTYGYLYINFINNGIYESGVQELYEGKWEIDENGDIYVEPWVEGEAENKLRLRSTYCLTNEYNTDVFYSEEYYDKYNASEDSKTETEIDLSEITKEDIIGLWVTDEQGPMGELLGFLFTEDYLYFGHPGLEIPFGCWDEVIYEPRGDWNYDNEEKIITIYWNSSNDESIIHIHLLNFYNGAFEGYISPDYSFDEVGDSERTFWKSECK